MKQNQTNKATPTKFTRAAFYAWIAPRQRIAITVGVILALCVCLPWFFGGRLLVLDWVVPSRSPILTSGIIGHNSSGLATGIIFSIPIRIASKLLGNIATILPLLIFFPVASYAISELIDGTAIQTIAGAIVYCVNPFVFDRIAVGQFGLLIGYAILPIAISNLKSPRTERLAWVRLGLWWTLLIICSPHFSWIFGIYILVFTIQQRFDARTTKNLILAIVFAGMTTIYVLFSGVNGGVGVHIGVRNLTAYQTQGKGAFGAFLNLTGLYGFWRIGPTLAKSEIKGWVILLAAILIIVALGYLSLIGKSKWLSKTHIPKTSNLDRSISITILGSGIVGLFLAMGQRGIFGGLYKFAFLHLPFFAIMREAQKFDLMWAVTLAYGFGFGVEVITKWTSKQTDKQSWISIILLFVLPIVYEPLIFIGLAGEVKTSHYPSSWAAARKLIDSSQGAVLCLPWHQYESFNFTQNRVIANPCQGYLGGTVIQGQNVELPNITTSSTSPSQAFLTYALANGSSIRNFGELLTPYGIHYLVVLKTVDWRNFSWLKEQSDLSRIFNSSSIEVFKNHDYYPQPTLIKKVTVVPNWGAVLAMADQHLLNGQIVKAIHNSPGPIEVPPSIALKQSLAQSKVTETLHFGTYHLSSSTPGYVHLALNYNQGWKIDSRPVSMDAFGQMYVRVNRGNNVLSYAPMKLAIIGDLISLSTLLAGIGALIFDKTKSSHQQIELDETIPVG